MILRTTPVRKFLLIILFSNFAIAAFTQTIQGYILNEKTKRKISDAIVYFDGTFYGTNSDKNGHFTLDISKYPLMPVTVSSGGYYSVKFDVVTPEKPVQIFLKPKIFESKEFAGNSNYQEEREKNLKLFRKTFLGATPNARICEISNENDIVLESDDSDTLKAFALNPVLICNKALGYKASYFLDKFVLNKKDETFFISGSIIFNEDMKIEITNKSFVKNREHAYLKSRMYFFRSLWENKLDSAGFIVKNALNEDLNYSDMVIDKGNPGKFLKHFMRINSSYDGNFPSTYIIFREKEAFYDSWGRLDRSCITEITLQNDIYFDHKGYYDPSDISWRGKLADQRIADLLPLEY